jgi:hypothetical protein
MTKIKISFLAMALVATLFLPNSCTKDKGKQPVSSTPPPAAGACDTITYSKHIKPIIDMNCALSGCHAGTTSNPLFTSYDLVKDRADAGRIKARAIDGPSFMPPSGRLPQAQIDLISCWLESGKKP